MKQRTREIIKSARGYADLLVGPIKDKSSPAPQAWIDAFESRFVELIVMECVDVGTTAWVTSEDKVFPADQIRSHFFG